MNEICMYNDNNMKNVAKIEKKTLRINTAGNDLYNTRLCGLTQSSVIWIIHRNVSLKRFFIYLHVCYYR